MLDAKALKAAKAVFNKTYVTKDGPLTAAITAYLQAVGPEPAVAELYALCYLHDWDPPKESQVHRWEPGKNVFPEVHAFYHSWSEAEAIRRDMVNPERYWVVRARPEDEARIRSALVATPPAFLPHQATGDDASAFKNFHRLLCERFGYTHDEKDWRRDQVSLIEWIARRATPPAEQHPDDIAVDCFAAAMKAKLKWEREHRNRSGWQAMSAADLSRILYEHLPKGDPVDVANLSMMLHQNGQQIETPPAEPVVEALILMVDAFLSRNGGCFPMDEVTEEQKLWKEAMKAAYAVVGQPRTRDRDEKLRALATKPAVKGDEPVVVALRKEADSAYCRFLDKMSAPLCLGVEYKLETGKFGAAELNAHVDARELYGFHRGINHALAALAATEGQNG